MVPIRQRARPDDLTKSEAGSFLPRCLGARLGLGWSRMTERVKINAISSASVFLNLTHTNK